MRETMRWRRKINRTKTVVINLFIALLLVGFTPLSAYAEDSSDATQPPSDSSQQQSADQPDAGSTTPADNQTPTNDPPTTGPTQPTGPSTTPGPTQPNGSDSSTFKLNPDTGMWENDYYIWDPATHQTRPKNAPTYSYNPTTGKWDTTQWAYNPVSGKYEPNVVSKNVAPKYQAPDSGDQLNVTNAANGIFNDYFNASISNKLYSGAFSGNAQVAGNTNAGSAATGNATVISNLFNLLQSSSNILGGGMNTFTQDIQGDVVGDLLINPDVIMSGGVTNANSDQKLTVNEKANGLINNDVTLDAQTGNASVSGNNTGGDATTGDANAIANIVNAINSYIGAGQGFMGTVNIYGNLDGDILLPPDVLQKLIASNGTQIDVSSIENNQVLADVTSNQAIDNNVTTTAKSGAANVSHNTNAGTASTGDANTKLTVLNLTGREVVGEDALLVFVNVLGKWVGLIVNAPGATAGAYGNANVTSNNSVDVNADQNSKIVNNVNVNAKSGDANVSNNTNAGDAKTGDATASANIANISNSSFNLTKWFGILFINVFGTWNGSFGVDTAAGTLKQTLSSMSGGSGSGNTSVQGVKAFKFVPGGTGNNKLKLAAVNLTSSKGGPTAVFASAKGGKITASPLKVQAKKAGMTAFAFQVAGISLAGALFGLERYLSARGRRQLV